MTVDSVRRLSRSLSSLEAGERQSYENFRFEFTGSIQKTQYVEDGLYSFPDIEVITGDFEYESEPLFGSSTTSSGHFQIRKSSGLVLVESESEVPRPVKVFNALREAIVSSSSGHSHSGDDPPEFAFQPHTDSILDFISRAEILIQARILDSKGKVIEVEDRHDDRLGTHPIEQVKLRFKKEIEGEERAITVTYSDDELRFHDDDEVAREYVLQHFEDCFLSNDG